MKKVILSVAILATVGMVSCKNDTKTDEPKTEQTNAIAMTNATFGVRGNCGMCKRTIEKAANTVEGVETAKWDVSKKQVQVTFDKNQTTLDAIHQAIANSGYDTDKVAGNVDSYKNLPGCCQYDHNMEMSLKEPLNEDHTGHNH